MLRRLPLRALVSRHETRFLRTALTCAWSALAVWMFVASPTVTAVNGSATVEQRTAFGENQPPRFVNFGSYYQGHGMWLFYGQIYDEHPAGMIVTVDGAPLANPLIATVQENGTFMVSGGILFSGLVEASTTDSGGLTGETLTYTGL